MSSWPLASVEMPRWAKMSPILPMAWVRPPAATTRSSSVGSGGGMARSLRLAVRTKVAGVSPTNGRAMTRPTRSGCTISAAMRQTS